MKRWISNIAAVLWFFGVLIWMLLMLPITLIMLPSDITSIMDSGFGTQPIGFTFLLVFGLIFGITMLVPAFRKCFRKLPWLYPYITILTADVAILSIGIELLNYGYQVQSDSRHTLFLVLMLVQIVVCRIALCTLCHKKPMRIAREDYEQ